MTFHLDFNPPASQQKLRHQEEILMMGSCFSEHIAERLSALKFSVATNPFGIVFNPESICKMLHRIIDKDYFTVVDIFEKEERFFSFEVHSLISSSSANVFLKELNASIDHWHENLKSCKFLTLTFGSAFAYWHLERKEIVANCHKFPNSDFKKRLFSSTNIIDSYSVLLHKLLMFNPKLNIVFTVSPVKHLRDGVVENNLSKAILIQSVHQLIAKFNVCHYFPAYELVNDDLRDYRFYEADMAHPNQQAIDYVWQKFADVYFDLETKKLIEKIQEINQAMNHRPFNVLSESHLKFKQTFHQKCITLSTEHPWLDLQTETNYFLS